MAKKSKDWIQGAIKHPGALTIKAGQSVSKFIEESESPTTKRQVAFAKTLK